jgi:hypothetical protein
MPGLCTFAAAKATCLSSRLIRVVRPKEILHSVAGRLSASSKVQSKMITASGFEGLTHEAAEVPQGGIGYRYVRW